MVQQKKGNLSKVLLGLFFNILWHFIPSVYNYVIAHFWPMFSLKGFKWKEIHKRLQPNTAMLFGFSYSLTGWMPPSGPKIPKSLPPNTSLFVGGVKEFHRTSYFPISLCQDCSRKVESGYKFVVSLLFIKLQGYFIRTQLVFVQRQQSKYQINMWVVKTLERRQYILTVDIVQVFPSLTLNK